MDKENSEVVKRKGRPKGSKDKLLRHELPLSKRLNILKSLITDDNLTSKERLDAIRLYSELQGDKKKDGYESLKLVFEVVPDRNIPIDALKEHHKMIHGQSNGQVTDNEVVEVVEEPLEAPKEPLKPKLTEEEAFEELLGKRDESIKVKQDKLFNGE